MTNKDFYAYCRDQRHVENDPERRDALTTMYNYMRECGVTKAGVERFANHCIDECARKGKPPEGYLWIKQLFAAPKPEIAIARNYQLLGAMIGSVYEENHPVDGWDDHDRARAARLMKELLGVYATGSKAETELTMAMSNAMQGWCSYCGLAALASEVNRNNRHGIYLCSECARKDEL